MFQRPLVEVNTCRADVLAVFGILAGIEARPDPELVVLAGTFRPARRIGRKFDNVRNVVTV